VQEVIAALVSALHAAGDDRGRIAEAFQQFIDAGFPVCKSPSALWDYLGTALRQGGYTGAGWDRRMRIYSTVSWERFSAPEPYPADWPWREHPDAEPGAAPDPAGM
jgi:hypothetical protein